MSRWSCLAALIGSLTSLSCRVMPSPPYDPESAGYVPAVAPVDVRTPEAALSRAPIRASDWRSAARAGDWLAVAAGIDILPESARSEPGTRYVRALAGQRLDDCETVLRVTAGLADRIPLLRAELDAMVRECELALGAPIADGPRVSPVGRLKAARFAVRAGDLARARLILDGLCKERSGKTRASADELAVQARELRAHVAERLGLVEQAASDYRWLALESVSAGADTAYERLARRLSAAERLTRAEVLAKRGRVVEVGRELQLMASAPGAAPSALERARIEALAHYNSRASYAQAARLYEDVARVSHGARASDSFHAASAWIRSGALERGIEAYERITKQHPGSPAEERALYRKAQAFYAAGRWEHAIEAYTRYLDRYGSPSRGGRFIRASLYERSVAELARGNPAAALEGFELLRRHRRTGYSAATIDHLEAVALASSGLAALEARAVERFELLASRQPLSYLALAGAARLRRMGRELPPIPRPPSRDPDLSEVRAAMPPKVEFLLDLGLHTAAERALHEQAGLESSSSGLETLCEHYASIDRGHRRYALAAGITGRVRLGRAPSQSTWWAWQCLYPRPYAATVQNLERRHALPAGLLHAVMRQESAFRPDATSPVGAVGLMQLMPRTAELAARELGIEHQRERLVRPRHNLELGAFYLGKLLETFGQRVVAALASYNAGPHATSRWLLGGTNLDADVWAARIPYAETRRYVARVMTNWIHYRYLAGGAEQVPELSLELPARLELPPDAY